MPHSLLGQPELQAVEDPTLLQLDKYISVGIYNHLAGGVSRDRVQVIHACRMCAKQKKSERVCLNGSKAC